jgi:hypothetical protein
MTPAANKTVLNILKGPQLMDCMIELQQHEEKVRTDLLVLRIAFELWADNSCPPALCAHYQEIHN